MGKQDESVTNEGRELGDSSGSWLRGRPWLIDLVLVLAVFSYNLPFQLTYARNGWLPLAAVTVISVGLCAPYVLRRRYPLRVFGILLLAAWVQLLLDVEVLPVDVMLAFALYNVATRFRWAVSVPAAGTVLLWLLVFIAPRLDEYYLSIGDLGVLILVTMGAWTWGTTTRIRRDYVASLQERARQLEREREAQARIVAAAERARIAREIHDIVSHSLSVMVVMADGASLKARTEPEGAEQAMVTVRDTGRTAMAEMRRMLDVLRVGEPGSHAPQPGIGQLVRLVAESKTSGLPVAMVVHGEPVELPAGLELAVYRIVQEALTNARKHGGTQMSNVAVQLHYRDDTVEVQVTDDGQGPDARPGGESGGGHGLVGMRERVAAYGGSLRADPRLSGGFKVVAVLPTGGAE